MCFIGSFVEYQFRAIHAIADIALLIYLCYILHILPATCAYRGSIIPGTWYGRLSLGQHFCHYHHKTTSSIVRDSGYLKCTRATTSLTALVSAGTTPPFPPRTSIMRSPCPRSPDHARLNNASLHTLTTYERVEQISQKTSTTKQPPGIIKPTNKKSAELRIQKNNTHKTSMKKEKKSQDQNIKQKTQKH